MKVSELIKELNIIQDTYGDLGVRVMSKGGLFGSSAYSRDLQGLAIAGIGKGPFVLVVPVDEPKEDK